MQGAGGAHESIKGVRVGLGAGCGVGVQGAERLPRCVKGCGCGGGVGVQGAEATHEPPSTGYGVRVRGAEGRPC